MATLSLLPGPASATSPSLPAVLSLLRLSPAPCCLHGSSQLSSPLGIWPDPLSAAPPSPVPSYNLQQPPPSLPPTVPFSGSPSFLCPGSPASP